MPIIDAVRAPSAPIAHVGCRLLPVSAAQPERHWLLDDPMATAVAHLPGLRDRRTMGPDLFGNVVAEIRTAEGASGFAIGVGGPATAEVVGLLAPILIGRDCADIAGLHDLMARMLAFRVGRGGPAALALSALDLALWDLAGKRAGHPVAALLGGATGRPLPIYQTGPDAAAAKALGFRLAKLTLPEGDTPDGLRRSLAFLEAQRLAVGPDYPLALDCWCGLDPALAPTFADMIRDLDLAWLEEPFLPGSVEPYRQLKAAAPWLVLATGEHEQSVDIFPRLAEAGVDMLQPDLRWCGGLTAALRILEEAAETGHLVYPHTAGVYSYHLAAGPWECGLVEYSTPSADGTEILPYHGAAFAGEPLPVGGLIHLSNAPGFGLTLIDEAPPTS